MNGSKWGVVIVGAILLGLMWLTKRTSPQFYVALALAVGIGLLYAPVGFLFLGIAAVVGFLNLGPGKTGTFTNLLTNLGKWFQKGGSTS